MKDYLASHSMLISIIYFFDGSFAEPKIAFFTKWL